MGTHLSADDLMLSITEKKGHIKPDYWKKGGRKEGQGPKQKGKTGNKEVAASTEDKSNDKPSDGKLKDGKAKEEEAWLTMVMDNVPDIDLAKIPSSKNTYDAAYLLGDALMSSLCGIVLWSSYLDLILSHSPISLPMPAYLHLILI